jgi:hypothetical protein
MAAVHSLVVEARPTTRAIHMKTRTTIGFGLATLLAAPLAYGQEKPSSTSSEYKGSAPAGAVEITTGGGYSQAFGDISKNGMGMDDVAGAGNMFQLGVGYRLNPHLMVGGYGEGAIYQPAEGSFGDKRNFSVATGAQAQWHFLPFDRWDPWVGAGAGWRGYWMVDDENGTGVLQGVDIVRAQVGVDYHFSPSFIVTPIVGVSVTQFVGEKQADDSSYHRLTDGRPVSFVSFGLGGRFDIGGKTVEPGKNVASR